MIYVFAILNAEYFVEDVVRADESYEARLKEIYKNKLVVSNKKDKYNTSAAIGYYYNKSKEWFVPFKSWTCDKDGNYIYPVPYPTDGRVYYWDEPTLNWVAYPIQP